MNSRLYTPFAIALVAFFIACTSGTPESTAQQDNSIQDSVAAGQEAAADIEPEPIDPSFTIEYLTGKFDPTEHEDFTTVAPEYTNRARTYYLRKDVYEAFQQMHAAAQEDGVRLEIFSATRNFDYQRGLWEPKWNGQRLLEGREAAPEVYPDPVDRATAILRWSSMPGTSRHHWGTDMDLNEDYNSYFESGEGLKVYEWLTANAATYGFCQPYSQKGEERPFGYNEEKWHWSYMPIAKQLTSLARTMLHDENISGFDGAEAAPEIGVVEKYMLGVNPACL